MMVAIAAVVSEPGRVGTSIGDFVVQIPTTAYLLRSQTQCLPEDLHR